jgi:hypothetical protein
LIDDGPIADAFLARFPKARLFDPTVHSFNPLAGIDYRRARDLVDIIYSAFPQGENTLTVRNGKRALMKLVLANRPRLDRLRATLGDIDDATIEALHTVNDLLLSPVLRRVLCGDGKPFKFGEGTTVAKLDRAELGDFDAFILGALLMGQHQGQIVVPDFGFYGRPLHAYLIRQDRLTAGVRFLEEVPRQLAQALLTIADKQGKQCTFDDAEMLAGYAGLVPGTTGHTAFVEQLVLHE